MEDIDVGLCSGGGCVQHPEDHPVVSESVASGEEEGPLPGVRGSPTDHLHVRVPPRRPLVRLWMVYHRSVFHV